MIMEIFDAVTDQEYHLSATASKFGLSKATLSRFAGIRWGGNGQTIRSTVPDLWRNTAKVLGSDPDFVEATKRAGVWKRVEAVCEGDLSV